jgi:hypothetical protein
MIDWLIGLCFSYAKSALSFHTTFFHFNLYLSKVSVTLPGEIKCFWLLA